MVMNRNPIILAGLAAALLLSGCGGDSSGGSGNNNADSLQTFTAFTKDLLANTSDTAEPVSVNDREFDFSDKDNPEAYDDVLSSN